MEQLIGRSIGKYRILGEIGRGTVGSVYRAYDPDLDRDVAIKVLASRNTWDQKFVQDFLQRARATTRLQHPNLVTVYDLGQREGWYCVVMELLEGISLHDLARLRGGLLLDEVWAITRQLADALDHIHGAGLIHGDVRAGNAILTPPDRVVLTELGVVRTSWEGRIATGAATAAVAPEQVSGAQMGPWTDLYSLGVVVYELLTAKLPFAAETVPTLLHQVLHQVAPPPTAARPDLPPAVDQVLQRALAKDPQLRYHNCADLAAALQEALSGAAQRTEPAAAPPNPTPRVGPPPPIAAEPAPLVLSTAPDAAPAEGGTPAPPPSPYAGPNGLTPPGNSPASEAPEDALRPSERRAPPAQEAPLWAAPTTARPIVPLPRRPQSPAERLTRSRAIITRVAPVPQPTEEPPAEPSEEPPAKRRPPLWMWAALGAEALILLVGVALLILLLLGK